MRAMDYSFEFKDGKLVPIKDPLCWGDGETDEVVFKRYGFDCASGQLIGAEFGMNMEIVGPAKDKAPYAWVVQVAIGEGINTVWCRTFIELHQYLLSVAPLLAVIVNEEVRAAIAETYRWLFDSEDGLYADHVRTRYWEQNRGLRTWLREAEAERTEKDDKATADRKVGQS